MAYFRFGVKRGVWLVGVWAPYETLVVSLGRRGFLVSGVWVVAQKGVLYGSPDGSEGGAREGVFSKKKKITRKERKTDEPTKRKGRNRGKTEGGAGMVRLHGKQAIPAGRCRHPPTADKQIPPIP